MLLAVDNADSLVHFTSLVYSQLKYFNMFSAVLFSLVIIFSLFFVSAFYSWSKSVGKSFTPYCFVPKVIVVPDVIKIIFRTNTTQTVCYSQTHKIYIQLHTKHTQHLWIKVKQIPWCTLTLRMANEMLSALHGIRSFNSYNWRQQMYGDYKVF